MSGRNDLVFCENRNVVNEANLACTFSTGEQVPPLAHACGRPRLCARVLLAIAKFIVRFWPIVTSVRKYQLVYV